MQSSQHPVTAIRDADQSETSSLQLPPLQHKQSDSSLKDEREPVSLADLPAEIIHMIAHHLRATEWRYSFGCYCQQQKARWARVSAPSFDLSKAPVETYSDRSWALSCMARRYRQIIFHGRIARRYDIGYSTCCIERVRAIPEHIRASVS
jgi:hypothetical protein